MKKSLWSKLGYTRIIALSFFLVIMVGTILLWLPISSRDGSSTPFLNCMFTATSATCVTGLVVYDTYLHWSLFGQVVILLLIQIGGIGLMTLITMIAIFLKKKISLHERRLLMQSAGNMRVSGMVRMIKQIIMGTFFFEGVGALVLASRFCPKYGWLEGLYYSVFHAVSAFCNAGFDLNGRYGPFSSLTGSYNDILVNITIMCLIIIGGIGFLVWNDMLKYGRHLHQYSLHAKLVLTITFILITGGWLLYFIFEYHGSSMEGMEVWEKGLASLFLSVTTRTAGFNTIDMGSLSDSSQILTMVLMFIGGCPGSTAGGIKTTTLVVMFLSAVAMARGDGNVTIFKRRIEENTVKQAGVIIMIYLLMVFSAAMFLCFVEEAEAGSLLFEIISAVATVGLSVGVTGSLQSISKIVLILLMFAGRIGGLSMVVVFGGNKMNQPLKRPTEKILIG